MATTRDRLLAQGMRLFGEQGYSATSVAQIESAAGLSAGSGAMYKHFRSKEQLLSQGLDRLLASRPSVTGSMAEAGPDEPATGTDSEPTSDDEVTRRLTAVARMGLRRMAEDRDVSRLLFRDLDAFPALLQKFGQGEVVALHRETAAMLAQLAAAGRSPVGEPGSSGDLGDSEPTDDSGNSATGWDALAVVLQGAVAHYWLLADLFDGHPTGVDDERFIAAVAAVAAATLARSKSIQTREK